MRLYDTARRAVVPFEPAPPPAEVRIYVCGITPYDSTHLGHANTYLAYDLLIRRLEDHGHQVRMVRNITDVDDSILPKARELGVDFLELAAAETARFRCDMEDLNTRPPEAEPKATEWVPEMVALIEDLTAAGHAYTAEGTTWFDVCTWPSFGRLGGYDDDTMRTLAAERGGTPDDPRQRNPLDFVLWQPSAPDEPSWDSPFGPGRPGWHIECSAMSMGLLGTGIDIHGGGSDLIFPHHECELAQSEAAVRQPFVKYWMHCGMVGYEGAKMSKSLGNLVFVSDLCKESAPAAVRLALMGHHYRDDWEWHDGDIAEGEALLDALNEAVQRRGTAGGSDPAPYARRLRDALDDDLDAPRARAVLAEVADGVIAGRLDDSAPGVLAELCALCGIALEPDPSPASLYDTLTGEVRPLATREPRKVALYACGPTVYDHPHLGHARSAITYDVLRRYLQWRGLDVRHVANVTDIDDNIINRARDEGRTESDVAAEWEAVYVDAMAALGVLEPHQRPRATEWVEEMVEFVARIMDAGAAYSTSTGVYLRVRDVDGYGDLVHRDLDDLRASAGARVEVDEAKEDPLDFALWKAAKPDEPSWPSPWGPGRPGWHIECVAMSLGILGDDFDIHGGGNDLVFPHHTNERAEALAVGRTFARHWVHNAMLNIEGTKMSKSLGNYRTVAEMLDEHPLNGRAFRLLVLQTHYRKTMEVNAELMASARSAVQRLDAMARRADAIGSQGDAPGVSHAESEQPDDPALERDEPSSAVDAELDLPTAVPEVLENVGARGARREAQRLRVRFQAAMDRDLGTPLAVARTFDALRRANAALDRGTDEARILVDTVVELAGVLGVAVDAGGNGTDADAAIEELVTRRQAAREARDWAAADALRDELAALGVIVEDTPAGPTWHRADADAGGTPNWCD